MPSVKVDSPPAKTGDTPPRLVMLVDDFYYGTFEGNRVYVPMDNSKEPLSFKCLSCNKRLKNNVRYVDGQSRIMDISVYLQMICLIFRIFPSASSKLGQRVFFFHILECCI